MARLRLTVHTSPLIQELRQDLNTLSITGDMRLALGV